MGATLRLIMTWAQEELVSYFNNEGGIAYVAEADISELGEAEQPS